MTMEAKAMLVRRSSFRRKSSSSSLTRHHHNSSATISSSSSAGRPARHKTASALHAATANGHLESVKLLLASNSNTTTTIDTLDLQGVTPLYVAACNGFLGIVRLLLDRGANVDFRDADGETPLYVATSNGFLEIVVILLDVGRANVNLGDTDGVTPLYIACEHGHLKIVRVLLDRGANAEIADSDGDTPLHVAAQNGHLEVVKLLLTRREVNVNQGNVAGVTALIMAAQNGFADIARMLIVQGGGDVNHADSEGVSPLCMASHSGHISVVHELLNQGGDVDLKGNEGESALYFAAQNGHVDVVQLLTERGADVDAADNVGVTALSIAAQNGHCRVVECLLDHGARADLVDCDGDTALIAASQYGHTDVVQLLLLRGGTAVDFPDADGATPLYLAAQNGHARVVTLLLQAGAEPDFAEGDGATPLYAAAYNGHAEVVESLLSHGAKADFVAEIGVTPLYAAAFNGYSEIAKILLARGVQVDFKTAVGVAPLYVASQNGFPAAVAVLVEGGANVNLAVPSGATPLYIAAQNGHLQVVDMLIKGGAIPDLADADGATPLYISCQNGHADVVELLLSRDVNIDCATPNGGVTPLYIAAQNGYIDVVQILLALGANVNRAATNGATPLYVVAQSGHLDIATLLLDKGARVNLTALNGTTLLHVASQHGHIDIVTQLIQHGADIDRADNDGDTPLMAAVQHGHVHIARVLLDSAARVDLENADGISPLYISAHSHHQDMLALLLRYGANVNQCAADGTTPLYAAAFHGYSKVMTLLLDENADADLSQGLSATPLYAAAYNGYIDAVRILLDRGAALGNAMADGTTPLYVAAQNGHYGVVKLLLDRGASLEFATEECPGPIFTASQNGHSSVVQLLIRRGANVNIADSNGIFPLLVASKFGYLDVIRLLVQAGAVVDAVDLDGNTPLISASRSGHIEIVQELLQNGAALNIANDAGETPVLAAGSVGKFDVVKFLVGAGASVHVKAKNGETLLISTARWSDLAFVAWLIELGYLNFESSKGSGVEASLIPATLQALGEYGDDLFEFQVMWRGAVERLKSIYFHFEDDQATETSLVQQFVAMIFRLLKLHQLCRKTNFFTRIAISADVVASIHDFYAEMDHMVRRVKSEISSLDGWSTEIRAEPDFFSSEMLPSDEELYSVVGDKTDQIEAVSLLHHVISAHSDKHSDRTLDLIELCLDKLLSLSNVHIPPIPSWFVPRHEVVIDASGLIQLNDMKNVYTGKWMNSSVVIVEYSETHDNFNEDAERWFQLSHPNVISLFGAFHLSLPHVAVFENSSHLREYLVNPGKSSSVWQRMLEVALGLKYLHERGIVLGKLMCDDIWVGTGGAAKICGFGLKFYSKISTEGLDSARWTSPEVLRDERASSASDVYSLGMCIIEAVTGLAPWGDEPCEQVRSFVKWGFRPCRPATMSIAQWRLIQCMCVYDPEKRLKIVSVIEHLRYFAMQEREESPERRAIRTSEGSKIAELGSSIDEFLARLRSKCLLCRSARDSVLYVHARLVDIHHHLQEMHKLPTDVAMTKLCEVLLNVDTFLRVAVSEASVTQRAKSQKVALKAHVHHKEIDELVDLLNIRKPGSIHDWEVKKAQLMMSNSLRRNRSDEVQAMAFGLKDGQTGPGVKILRFESKHLNEKFNPTKFTLVDRRIRDQAEPPWFIPMHELKFQQDGYIAAGSFGAIYHGSWLGTSVVVKLMGYEDEANGLDFFLHELRVWYPLSHPHVVKLYGACHVGKRFFVCEYASNGTLQEYLEISERRRVLWQKLHELALGLQYLHELNIVHNDLKCDNCLIASDGKAKLADFGLSCIPNSAEIRVDIKMQGAQHWKSPEHLQGERPTKASDIYSLGMCVVEAVTGEAPWGGAVDVMVRFHVKRGRLPPRPVFMTDDQWGLIEMMCAFDPKNRIKVQSVVERLEEFSKQDAKRATLEPDPKPRS